MPQSNSFWEHPIEKIEEALSLRKQIATLQAKLSNLLTRDQKGSGKAAPRKTSGGKRTMSPEARARIAAAQKARWAKAKGESSSPVVAAKSKAAKKRTISAEARAKMAAAAKKRWAAKNEKS